MGKVRPHIGLRKRMTGTGNERKNDMIQACERGARIAAESRVSNIMCKWMEGTLRCSVTSVWSSRAVLTRSKRYLLPSSVIQLWKSFQMASTCGAFRRPALSRSMSTDGPAARRSKEGWCSIMLKEPLYRNIVPVPLYACGDGSLTIGSSTCHPASRSRAARANFTGICGNMSRKICGLSACANEALHRCRLACPCSFRAAIRCPAHLSRSHISSCLRASRSGGPSGGGCLPQSRRRTGMAALWLNDHVLVLLRDMKGPSWEVNTLAAKQSMTKRPYNEQHAMPHHALSGCGHGGGTQTADQACSQAWGQAASHRGAGDRRVSSGHWWVQIGYKWESIRSKWGYDYL